MIKILLYYIKSNNYYNLYKKFNCMIHLEFIYRIKYSQIHILICKILNTAMTSMVYNFIQLIYHVTVFTLLLLIIDLDTQIQT